MAESPPLDKTPDESTVHNDSPRADDTATQKVTYAPVASHPKGRARSESRASRVELDHFDPSGMATLRKTLSRMSAETGGIQEADELHPSRESTEGTFSGPLDTNFDFEKTLRLAMRRGDASDIKRRELGVSFEGLRVVGLGASTSYQETLGSLLNPLNFLRSFQESRHPALRDILSGFDGAVRPGEMLLVLGSPGSGCSTLLKTLANQRKEYHLVEGDVHYDSFSPEEMARTYRGDIIYVPEDDVHFPTLTVNETIRFAATMRAPHERIDGNSREHYIKSVTEVLETLFGLRHATDTKVGDQSVRGVSGGEKKRVSIAEALASRARIGSWDNSTRGLDASTALEFVRALRIGTDVTRVTTIVSIYQAGESLYELFDKVCVICEGQMAYFGPANLARQHFIDMGYEPVNRQTTADFLVAVTDPVGRRIRKDFAGPIPRTASEFAAHFRGSAAGRANASDIAAYRAEFTGQSGRISAYKASAQAEHARWMRSTSPYTISIWMQARAVAVRRVQIVRGAYAEQVINTAIFIVQAVIVGSVFVRLPAATSAFFSRGGVLFFSLLFSALATMSEIPALYGQRPIVLRHHAAALYHPFTQAAALTLVDIPITAITLAGFTLVLYFVVGLQQSAGQFFTFYLFIFTATQAMKAWFRMLASVFKSAPPAQTVAGLSVLILVLYTGYTIPRPSMIGALRWLTYINPLRYGFEGLLVNEFHTLSGACSNVVPQGPGYEGVSIANQVCTTVGAQPGQTSVNGNAYLLLSYGFSFSDLWRNFGILVAFCAGFLALLLVFTELNTGSAGQTSVTTFKRGSKAPVANAAPAGDEEKVDPRLSDAAAPADHEMAKAAVKDMRAMTDTFSWQHVNYTVTVSGGEKRQLLDDVSGYVVPGKLTALMGESGAGKTTLLNVLAERQAAGVVTGDRFVNGQALPIDFQAQTGYCQQTDTHLETATVREALMFSAKMRQPQSVPLAEKEAYVEQCLKMCGLAAYADAVVGSLGVEHRKRTTIGVELVAKPKLLLFLDEPTSGLDSQSAWAILAFLRSLADNGTAILCTIHQPSAELFQQFDRMLLLKKGGKTVYFGDVGENATTLIHYFERNGGRHIRSGENPAEYMLDVIGAGATASSSIEWHDAWLRAQESRDAQAEIDAIHVEGRSRPAVAASLHSEFATSWLYQLRTLLQRNVAFFWRDPTYLLAKLTLNIFGGLLIGFTFWKSKDTQQGTQNKLFAVFMASIVSVPLANQLQVPFLHLRDIYETRERPSRMYSWTALITSQILVEIPWNILGSSLFFFCWYWTVAFETSRAGYMYLFMAVIAPMYYTTISQAVASMAPNAQIAGLLFSFLFSFVLMFNGVMQPFRALGWWQWMYRLSPYTYMIEGLLGQALGRQQVNCSSVELAHLTPPSGKTCSQYMQAYMSFAGGYLANPDATTDCQFCSTRTTDEFLLNNFNISYTHRWRNLGIFIAFIAFNVTAIYTFTYLFRIRTGSLLGSIKRRLAHRK